METASKGVTYHDKIADVWDERYKSGSFKRRLDFTHEKIYPALNPSGQWLDAGCGAGTFSRALAQSYDVTFTGVDASAPMVADAASKAEQQSLEHKTSYQKIETLENLPFESAQFDGEICFSVLEYIDNPSQALSELSRVLKPGGCLAISIPNNMSFVRCAQKISAPLLFKNAEEGVAYLNSSKFEISKSKAKSFFAEHGFEISQVHSFDPFIPPYAHIILPPSLLYFVCKKL